MAYVIAKYLRISAEDIDLDGIEKYESDSIENQRNYLDDFISNMPEFQGCEVIEELDDGRTGTNFSRPGIQRLLNMAEKGEIHCIICKDLSRFGRSYIEVGDYLEQKFPAWGVRFISLNDGYDSAQLNGGTAGINIAFRNLIYELYSRDISDKARQGKVIATKNGRCTNSVPVYGYVKDPADKRKLLVDEPAAAVIRHIFDLAEQGYRHMQIARTLNDKGIPSPKEHKKRIGLLKRSEGESITFWNSSTVSKIIHDEQYIGHLIFGKRRVIEVGKDRCKHMPRSEWVVSRNAIPAIISEEQFKEVNLIVPKQSKPEQKTVNEALLFRGKLKCGQCGKALAAYKTKWGLKYFCRTPKLTEEYGCFLDRLFENEISAVVLAALQHLVSVACEVGGALSVKAKSNKPSAIRITKEKEALLKLIDKCKTAKMSLWEQYHTKEIAADSFQSKNEKIDNQIKHYNGEIGRLQKEIADLEAAKSQDNAFVQQFSKHTGLQELTRGVVVDLIEEIKVFSAERIEIVFNYADEYGRINELI